MRRHPRMTIKQLHAVVVEMIEAMQAKGLPAVTLHPVGLGVHRTITLFAQDPTTLAAPMAMLVERGFVRRHTKPVAANDGYWRQTAEYPAQA